MKPATHKTPDERASDWNNAVSVGDYVRVVVEKNAYVTKAETCAFMTLSGEVVIRLEGIRMDVPLRFCTPVAALERAILKPAELTTV